MEDFNGNPPHCAPPAPSPFPCELQLDDNLKNRPGVRVRLVGQPA